MSLEYTDGKPVIIIGATNRPDSLDPALRRAGRFDREIRLGIPDVKGREAILGLFCKKLRLHGDFDFPSIAKRTPGYVGADLKALTREAAMTAVQRIISQNVSDNVKSASESMMMVVDGADGADGANGANGDTNDAALSFESQEFLDSLFIEMCDFEVALTKVQPSAKREGFAVVPEVTWNDIGALHEVREELRMAIVEPIRHPEKFEAVGLSAPVGLLLFGPPGCGKTLLAKAIANESHSNFISVKGPELLNKASK